MDMSRIHVVHKECGGPLIEDEDIHPEHPLNFLTQDEFSITCLTCLQEVTDPSELAITEILSQ
jgi:hypothetical protein